jgi:ATP-binding cassette, subfamily C, bacterial LapB
VRAQSKQFISGSTDAGPAAGDDPLLRHLGWIARYHGLGFSGHSVLSGLPLDDGGHLNVNLVPRAAAQCGLSASIVQQRPSSVPAHVAPFIINTDDGVPILVVRVDAGSQSADVIDGIHGQYNCPWAELDRMGSGTAILFAPVISSDDAAAPVTAGIARPAGGHWLWSQLARLWPVWLKVLIAACLINILGLAMPLFVMQVYDRVLPNQTISTLWALTAGVIIAIVFELILRQLRTAVLDHAGREVDVKVGSALFQHILAVPLASRRQSVGAIANQIREFETVRDVFTSASVIAVTDLVFIAVVVAVMAVVAGPLAWTVILAVPVVIVLTLMTLWPLGRAVRANVAQASRRHGILVESLAAAETLKAINAEGVMQRRWEDAVAATTRSSTATKGWASLALNISLLVQQIVGIVIIVWGVFLVNDGVLTVGALIAASMLSARALAPLANIAMTITRAQNAVTALRGINAVMALPTERLAAGETIEHPGVAFNDVTFRYPGQANLALAGLTLKITPGERIGIIGRVGSGKSTLGRLLARLYEPASGTVMVGGLDIASVDTAEVRAAVGYLGQDIELFQGTLRDNLTLGRRDATVDEITAALHFAGADGVVAAHPLGLAQPLGERGQGLSGGQRQAVGLARALLRQPKVLFLDEPSSAMDTGSETELVRRLGNWCNSGRALIVCTHRLQLLDLCDRLIVMDGGRIIADGPKAQVLATLRPQTPVAAAAKPVPAIVPASAP